MSGVFYAVTFLAFSSVAAGAAWGAEWLPRRAGRGFWALLAAVAATADLLTSAAWARLLGLTFAQFEANPVAASVGPWGALLIQSAIFLVAYGGCRASERATGPTPEAGLERTVWTALALRSTLLCVWNAYICLPVIMSA